MDFYDTSTTNKRKNNNNNMYVYCIYTIVSTLETGLYPIFVYIALGFSFYFIRTCTRTQKCAYQKYDWMSWNFKRVYFRVCFTQSVFLRVLKWKSISKREYFRNIINKKENRIWDYTCTYNGRRKETCILLWLMSGKKPQKNL